MSKATTCISSPTDLSWNLSTLSRARACQFYLSTFLYRNPRIADDDRTEGVDNSIRDGSGEDGDAYQDRFGVCESNRDFFPIGSLVLDASVIARHTFNSNQAFSLCEETSIRRRVR
jgi:hypothetical protein